MKKAFQCLAPSKRMWYSYRKEEAFYCVNHNTLCVDFNHGIYIKINISINSVTICEFLLFFFICFYVLIKCLGNPVMRKQQIFIIELRKIELLSKNYTHY